MAIYLTRTEPSQNMARFWTVAVQRNLFGHYVALRQRGRIGTHGQVCEEWFDEERQAVHAAAGFLKAKLKRGYNPVGTVTLTEHRSKCGIWRHDQICT